MDDSNDVLNFNAEAAANNQTDNDDEDNEIVMIDLNKNTVVVGGGGGGDDEESLFNEDDDGEMHNEDDDDNDDVEDDDDDNDNEDDDNDDGDSIDSESMITDNNLNDNNAIGLSNQSVTIECSNSNMANITPTNQSKVSNQKDASDVTNVFKTEEEEEETTTTTTSSTISSTNANAAVTETTTTKRTSGRLRKVDSGKVPIHQKNLFPGRPGRNNRPKRKFAQNLILNFSDSSTTMIKSETIIEKSEEILIETKQPSPSPPQQEEQKSISTSSTIESTANETIDQNDIGELKDPSTDSVVDESGDLLLDVSSSELITETLSGQMDHSSIHRSSSSPSTNEPDSILINNNNNSVSILAETNISTDDKIVTAKKKLNISGKIKGKLSGNRRNKTIEYRKKRGPKGKFKNYNSTNTTSTTVGLSSSSYASISFYNGGYQQSTNNSSNMNNQQLTTTSITDNNSQDDNGGIENKIILCSSKDNFLLSQDICVNCGSLGKGDDGRLIACAQCGQCYHLFCAQDSQPTKITKTMLNKGWRCLECTVCEGCGKATDDSRLLLCDDCDISYHTYCLEPPLEEVPQGTWKCQWCAICTNCQSTKPGFHSEWQENYTLCGPCASQQKCSICKLNYNENDLIIQCIQCQRWLHSKCDSLMDENECEIASSIGYQCLNCRPLNELPSYIQARKNGTLRTIFNKKRQEERNDPELMKKSEQQQQQQKEVSGLDQFDSNINRNEDLNNQTNSMKLLSKYHLVDGIYLSETGLAMIKSQQIEQPKKTRSKRKNNNKDDQQQQDDQQQSTNGNKEQEITDNNNDNESEEEKKKRLRRLRLDKLGIGGFLIKQRGGNNSNGGGGNNNRFDETSQDFNNNNGNYFEPTRSTTPENASSSGTGGENSRRRRRRINKKKNQLQDQYPSYLQEAFFGKDLLDVITTASTAANNSKEMFDENDGKESNNDDDNDIDDIDGDEESISKDAIVDLNSLNLGLDNKTTTTTTTVTNGQNIVKNNDDLNFFGENFAVDDLISPVDLFDKLFNDDDENELLNELSVATDGDANDIDGGNNPDDQIVNDIDDDVIGGCGDNKSNIVVDNVTTSVSEQQQQQQTNKMNSMDDILDPGFNFGSLNASDGLPQMDSKDVEDFLVMSNNSMPVTDVVDVVVAPPPSMPPASLPPQLVAAPSTPHPNLPIQQQQTEMIPHHHHHQHGHHGHHHPLPHPHHQHHPSQQIMAPNMSGNELSTPVTPVIMNDSISNLHQQFSNTFDSLPPNHPQHLQHPHPHHAPPPNHTMAQQQASMVPPQQSFKPHPQQQQPLPIPPSNHQDNYYHHNIPQQPPPPPPPSSQIVSNVSVTETDSEPGTSQGQKNFIKWEAEEALGRYATISAVLYANVNHTNLKHEFPEWSNRLKQIHKIWRQLSTEQRQPWLQMARDNRSAQKKNQTEMINKTMDSGNNNGKKMDTGYHNHPQQQQQQSASQLPPPPSPLPSSSGNGGGDYHHHHQATKMYSSPPIGGPIISQMSPNPTMMQQQQPVANQQQQHPMSPIILSPRLRPYNAEQVSVSGGYPQQQSSTITTQHMVRPPFSPSHQSSPNIGNVTSVDIGQQSYQSSSMSPAGQRSQSPYIQQPSTPNPYITPVRTPFSPSSSTTGHHQHHHAHHQQQQQPGTPHQTDPYSSMPSSVSSQPLMAPSTPDSPYGPIQQQQQSSVMTPSTPQPQPQSPAQLVQQQSPITSDNSMIYARSPRPSLSTINNSNNTPPIVAASNQQQQIRCHSFDESYGGGRQSQPQMYSPQYMQQTQQQQNPFQNDSYGNMNSPVTCQADTSGGGGIKVQMMRPGGPRQPLPPGQSLNQQQQQPPMIRRALSDPYNSGGAGVGIPVGNPIRSQQQQQYVQPKMDEIDGGQNQNKQHLRNLLQVHQMRRSDSLQSTPSPSNTPQPQLQQQQQRPPIWSTDQQQVNNFRQPMSPIMAPRMSSRMPYQSSMDPNQQQQQQQQNYRFRSNIDSAQQRPMTMMGPGIVRYPPPSTTSSQQSFNVRFTSSQQQLGKPRSQQQWNNPNVPSSSPISTQQPIRMPIQSCSPNDSMIRPSQSPLSSTNIKPEMIDNQDLDMSSKQQSTSSSSSLIVGNVVETVDETIVGGSSSGVGVGVDSLAVDDDELLQLGNDFNILEYADPDASMDGRSVGKTSIFDELDEKDDMLANENKEKSGKKIDVVKNENVDQQQQQSQQQIHPTTTTAVTFQRQQSHLQQQQSQQPPRMIKSESQPQQQQGQYFSSDSLLSDDDFERLKNDFFNDEQPQQQQPQQPTGYQQQQQQQSTMMQSNQMSQLATHPQQQQQQPILHQQQRQQYNPNNAVGGWPSPQQQNRLPYQPQQQRMHIRTMLPQQQQAMMGRPQHMMPQMYPNTGPGGGQRIMLQQQQQQPVQNPHLLQQQQQMSHARMIQQQQQQHHRPPMPGVGNVDDYNEMTQQQNSMLQRQKTLETEIAQMRKTKKSLNARQRQCRKNQNELNEMDAEELARVTQRIHDVQKQLDQVRKYNKQNNIIPDKRKTSTATSAAAASSNTLPHSPGANRTQTPPTTRLVNSPSLAALSSNQSGPNTPLAGISSTTPQSPSLINQSPSSSSSLMQNNSPVMSGLHSPATVAATMPQSPMTIDQSSMIVTSNVVGIRPQIVQDDNNPFSDVYLQKEKKQQQQQSIYHQQQYQSGFDDGQQQQQYYQHPGQSPYQRNSSLSSFPPPQSPVQTYPQRFPGPSGPINTHFVQQQQSGQIQQQQSVPNYQQQQQIRRPPPPPYPGNPQQQQQQQHPGYCPPSPVVVGGGGYRSPHPSQQLRMPMRNPIPPSQPPPSLSSQTIDPSIMQPTTTVAATHYQDPGHMQMMQQSYQQQQQQMNPMMDPSMIGGGGGVPIVGEAETTMEFTLSEQGNGVDNESDPFTFLKENAMDSENKQSSQQQVEPVQEPIQEILISSENNDNNLQQQQQQQSSSSDSNQQQQSSSDIVETVNHSTADDSSDHLPDERNDDHNSNQSGIAAAIEESPAILSTNQIQSDTSKQPQPQQQSSDDDDAHSIKQNALLKKLLQNCPSADHLKSLALSNQQQQQQQQISTNDQNLNKQESLPTAISSLSAVISNETSEIESKSSTTISLIETTAANVETKDSTTISTAPVENAVPVTVPIPATTINESSTTPTTPTLPVKKPSYLDIRRAQLEREPTPPPEDKPKRKRTVKRKESQKSIDSQDSTSQDVFSNNSNQTTMTKTKKRPRKSSQTKCDENSNDSTSTSNEKLLTSIINHFRTLPAVQIVEPDIQVNLNVCLPPDSSTNGFNSSSSSMLSRKKTQLKGCYGNAYLPTQIDYYSYYPFGPNRPTPNMIPSNSTTMLNSNQKVGYYQEEFGRSFMDNFNKDESTLLSFNNNDIKDESFSLYSRDIDSPETIVSSSSPECMLYNQPKDEYNRMKYINDNSDNDDENDDDDDDYFNDQEDRKSPFITFLPIRPLPLYSDNGENNKENEMKNHHHQNHSQKTKSTLMNKYGHNQQQQQQQQLPLKEYDNNAQVEITLMINPKHNIKEVMEALAKLLKLKTTFTYNVEKSSSSITTTEVIEIKNSNKICCKYCHCTLDNDRSMIGGDNLTIMDDNDQFCNKECFKNYTLTNVKLKSDNNNFSIKHEDMDIINDESMDIAEPELLSIFNSGTGGGNLDNNSEPSTDIESIISINEKHWKNTRYLYWNNDSFKRKNIVATMVDDNDNSAIKLEDMNDTNDDNDNETVEELLDRLEICLKPNRTSQEKRQCIFCHELGDGCADGPSRLLNMDVDKWVHLNCALWSYEVYEMCNGALMNVDQAYNRAMNSVCVKCSKLGASIKCFRLRCNNSYHFPCAIKEKCVFYTDKTLFCPTHSAKGLPFLNAEEMNSFVVNRKVYINRDEQKQIAAMLHHGDDNNLMRIGSLIFLNIGQLLPHQLQNFHTETCIYPIGYKVSRFYWSPRHLGKRCQYICSIAERNERPLFIIEVKEDGYETILYEASTPKLAWEKIIKSIVQLREQAQTIKVFFDFITGEDLFGLKEPSIVRILESLPGIDQLDDYKLRYGRSPWYELPLAINPSGCARSEPFKRFHYKRPHTLHISSTSVHHHHYHHQYHYHNHRLSTLPSPLINTDCSSSSSSLSLYVKPFAPSKVSQYRKMKLEWRNNVSLGRSQIQGLGLYAKKDIEKHTMIIEYTGLIIRNHIADRNERIYEQHNRGIYMFRLDDNRIIDATLQGGLARYVNHSCDPNCVTDCVQIDRENKILIVANRKIQKGEELTYDYKFDVEDDQHKIPCLCGAANCRKWMN